MFNYTEINFKEYNNILYYITILIYENHNSRIYFINSLQGRISIY